MRCFSSIDEQQQLLLPNVDLEFTFTGGHGPVICIAMEWFGILFCGRVNFSREDIAIGQIAALLEKRVFLPNSRTYWKAQPFLKGFTVGKNGHLGVSTYEK